MPTWFLVLALSSTVPNRSPGNKAGSGIEMLRKSYEKIPALRRPAPITPEALKELKEIDNMFSHEAPPDPSLWESVDNALASNPFETEPEKVDPNDLAKLAEDEMLKMKQDEDDAALAQKNLAKYGQEVPKWVLADELVAFMKKMKRWFGWLTSYPMLFVWAIPGILLEKLSGLNLWAMIGYIILFTGLV
eukprot:c8904_g1_i3.p1 GENE.c8904_g1_i3~~c8904_g1_i3.p1  ORF type:complete len:206 (+),score=49.76 c8904_g1_i3:51-620(+)